MTSMPTRQQSPWSALRRFVRPRPPAERCELCGARAGGRARAPGRARDPAAASAAATPARSCSAASEDARYRRVPPRRRAPDRLPPDRRAVGRPAPADQPGLLRPEHAGGTGAWPSIPVPAGATESLLTLEAWDALVEENPVLRELEPDVEALLVNRLGRDARRITACRSTSATSWSA